MILHADGFAHYGTGSTSRTNMAAGVFAAVGGNSQCQTTIKRGDGTHALSFASGNSRRVLGGNRTVIGFAAGYYLAGLPSDNNNCIFVQFLDSEGDAQFTVTVGSTGTLIVRNGSEDGSVIAQTASPVLVASAFNHVELRATVGNAGDIEIRVNGESVLSATPIDTQATVETGVEQYLIGQGNTVTVAYYADLVVWDTLGGVNDDFVGDVQCFRIDMTSDQAASDWTRNTGSSDFSAIDDTNPDGDSTYVEATAAAQVSEYGMTDVPANVSDIIGFVTYNMARKTDAGSGSMQVSVLSAGDAGDGVDRPMTELYTYWQDVFDTNPDTGARFTPAEFNAATLRINRTA